jgi:hypothetical protein
MTIDELIVILAVMNPEKSVFVNLIRADGTSEVFDVFDVRDNNGNLQIDIKEENNGN